MLLLPRKMNLYYKYAMNWAPVQRVDEITWKLLAYCIEKFNVKTCVEFGCGLSTKLMDASGVKATAFEDVPKYIHPLLKNLNQSTVVGYDDISKLRIESYYDMAFIDGPHEEREPAYKLVAEANIPLVICHDVWRSCEHWLSHKYFDDMHVVGKVTIKEDMMRTVALML